VPIHMIRRRTYGPLAIARRHPELYARLTWATAEAVIAQEIRRQRTRAEYACRPL
jgi:hypothetical protein